MPSTTSTSRSRNTQSSYCLHAESIPSHIRWGVGKGKGGVGTGSDGLEGCPAGERGGGIGNGLGGVGLEGVGGDGEAGLGCGG
eukprot:1160994-Pelagomonas_calceolata.AAC.1